MQRQQSESNLTGAAAAPLWISAMALLVFAAVPAQASYPAMNSYAIIDSMIEAHGGMDRWANAPTVSFEDEFKPGSAEQGSPSRVVVEQGPRRAYIDIPGTEMRLSWDGEKAWSENWQGTYPPRFLALLNYHFLNLPWLARDPGVQLGEPGRGRLWDDPTDYITIKITYGAGVGDTPRDYYTLYIHPETHRLAACEYIVTYKALLPEGVEAAPPHILVYDEFTEVHGLSVPTRYTIYDKDHSVYASCDVRDWSFTRPFDASRMIVPAGAVVDDSTP